MSKNVVLHDGFTAATFWFKGELWREFCFKIDIHLVNVCSKTNTMKLGIKNKNTLIESGNHKFKKVPTRTNH